MELIRPHMGTRRRAKIVECLQAFELSVTKRLEYVGALSRIIPDDTLVTAWLDWDKTKSFRKFAESVGSTARVSLRRRLDRLTLNAASVEHSEHQSPSFKETAWLAGILEGEGSFRPGRTTLNVTLRMTDEDVVERFSGLTSTGYYREPPRQEHWKSVFVVNVYPYMGVRRAARIAELLLVQDARETLRTAREKATSARLPSEEFRQRWLNKTPGDSLSSVAAEFRVHPQSLKRQLQKLGIYHRTRAMSAALTS